jgi:hypothetical protein
MNTAAQMTERTIAPSPIRVGFAHRTIDLQPADRAGAS